MHVCVSLQYGGRGAQLCEFLPVSTVLPVERSATDAKEAAYNREYWAGGKKV